MNCFIFQNCRIYLCGTKRDLIQKNKNLRAVDYYDVTDYADEIHAEVFETSSKTGEGVCKLTFILVCNWE